METKRTRAVTAPPERHALPEIDSPLTMSRRHALPHLSLCFFLSDRFSRNLENSMWREKGVSPRVSASECCSGRPMVRTKQCARSRSPDATLTMNPSSADRCFSNSGIQQFRTSGVHHARKIFARPSSVTFGQRKPARVMRIAVLVLAVACVVNAARPRAGSAGTVLGTSKTECFFFPLPFVLSHESRVHRAGCCASCSRRSRWMAGCSSGRRSSSCRRTIDARPAAWRAGSTTAWTGTRPVSASQSGVGGRCRSSCGRRNSSCGHHWSACAHGQGHDSATRCRDSARSHDDERKAMFCEARHSDCSQGERDLPHFVSERRSL